VIEVVGGLALLAALGLAFGAWRLSQGPLSIEFLRPYLADVLRDARSPLRLEADDTFLAWGGWGKPLSIRTVGGRVLDQDGRSIATVPEASIGVSLRALARGMFAPTTITLIGPQATALRDADGNLSLRLGASEAGQGHAFDALVAALLAPPDRGSAFGYLRRVSIENAKLYIEDLETGRSWVAPTADVIFSKDQYGVRVDASLNIDLGDALGRVDGEAEYRTADRTSTAVVWFYDLSPAVVAAKMDLPEPFAAIQAPMRGSLRVSLDPEFNVTGGEVELAATAGRIELPELWPTGLPIRSASLKGTLTRDPDRFTVTEFKADAGALTVSFTGSGTRLEDAIAIGGEIDAASSSIDEWGALWPLGIAEGARGWILANMEKGSVPAAHATIALRLPNDPAEPVKLESVAGTFRVEGTTVHYLRPLAPVTKASGRGTFDADRITIKLTAGTLNRLSVEGGTVDFTKLDRNPSHVAVDVNVRGPLRDPLEILDNPRFRYMQKLGIDPAKVDGEMATRIMVGLPTLKDIKMENVSLKVASNIEGMAIRGAFMDRDLSEGAIALKLDNKGMDLSGTAKIANLPSEITWVENFDPKDPVARRYHVTTRLDDAARAGFGFDLAPYVTGPTPVEMAFSQPVKGPSELQLRLTLDEAALALADLDWKKPPGEPGAATLVAALDGDKLRSISHFAVQAPNLEIAAVASFAPDGKTPSRIDIGRIKAGATELKGQILHRDGGGWNVDITGPSLNASRLIRPENEDRSAPKRTKPPLTINLDIGRAWLRSATPIEKIKGQLVYDGREWSTGALDATLPQNHMLALRLMPASGAARFTLNSDDAGETLRQFGIYDHFLGGQLGIDATRTGGEDGPWTGTASIADFRAVKAPALAKLLTVASLTGIASILSGQGIYFTRFDLPFTLRDEVLTLEKARLVGSELGLTGEGEIDFGSDRMKVTGTVVPAYTINSLLGNIPLIGRIFTGSEGSGIFAATYRLEGPLDDPSASVNPLAMLAPGFLRTLIEGIGGVTAGEEMPQPDYRN
jgi:hypothetical protein